MRQADSSDVPAVIISFPSMRVLHANVAAQRALGVPWDALVGVPCTAVLRNRPCMHECPLSAEPSVSCADVQIHDATGRPRAFRRGVQQ